MENHLLGTYDSGKVLFVLRSVLNLKYKKKKKNSAYD